MHLNPARANLLGREEKLSAYRWSRLRLNLQPLQQRPAWLRVDRLLGEHGISSDGPVGRSEFGRRMELRRAAEDDPAPLQAVRRGWCLGGKQFRHDLLTQMKRQMGEHHYGEERAQAAAEQAEEIVRAGWQRLGWNEADLEARAKGDREKLKLAVRLRAETTVTVKWIAQRLRMETWTHLNHLLYWHRCETTS